MLNSSLRATTVANTNATTVANNNVTTSVVISALNELHRTFLIDHHDKEVLMAEREAVKTTRDLELFVAFAKQYEHGKHRPEDWRMSEGCTAELSLTQLREICGPDFYERGDKLPEETWDYLLGGEKDTYDEIKGRWSRLEELEKRYGL